jgi:hypothetical protein
MADAARYRTFVETPEYSAQFEAIAQTYSDEVLETLLLGVFWGMATNAEQYDKVTWKILRARGTSSDPKDPRFDVLFEIKDENTIGLLWIQEIGGIEELTIDE